MNIKALPGAELISPGLEDLKNGQNDTVEALLIAIALTRLTNAGLTIPKTALSCRTRANSVRSAQKRSQ